MQLEDFTGPGSVHVHILRWPDGYKYPRLHARIAAHNLVDALHLSGEHRLQILNEIVWPWPGLAPSWATNGAKLPPPKPWDLADSGNSPWTTPGETP